MRGQICEKTGGTSVLFHKIGKRWDIENSRVISGSDEVVTEDKKSKLVMKLLHVFNSSQIWGLKPHARQAKPIEADAAADFYGTVIHELAHASGSAKRLNRLHRDTRFGSAPYAREELVAEFCAAMMLGNLGGGLALGPTHIANHASYIESWVKCLRADKNAIFTAAGAAEKACEYLRERALALSNEAKKQQTIEELKPQPLQLERKTKMRMF